NKLWIQKALDRSTRRTAARVLGHRDTTTFKKLYNKVKHIEKCIFYSDNWDAFAKVLPRDCHIIGKKHTTVIEQDNSNTCHYLGRFTRRTKVVSKLDIMVDTSIKLWTNMTTPEVFTKIQTTALSIYK
ncbi:MAG: IS1 family transposase, partial [Candidatus Bathyarchaeota archaeon]|nr:IS1 family transposase [Candidatus Termiticorpusculum sp.]